MDNAGNRTSKADYLAGVTSSYTYDPIYELTQVTQGNNTTESYSYDAVGNRTASLGVPSYTVNVSNELTATSNATYTYDSNGNTLTKTAGSNTTTYAWDFENRLTSVTLPGTGGTVTFKYDFFGRRIEKVSPTFTSVFAYDGENLIETVNSSGSVVSRYAQNENIDEPLAEERSGTTSYYEADGLGSVTSLSTSAGAMTNRYTYDSFGNLTASSGSVSNPFQYTAREFDTEAGLYFYRARYYDQSIGSFLSEDPAKIGNDFYAYADGNPQRWVDPLGLYPAVQVTLPDGSTYIPMTTVKNAAQAASFGLPIGTSTAIAVPPEVDPQAQVNYWNTTWAKGPLRFDWYWRPYGPQDYKRKNDPMFDAYGNFGFGATGAASGEPCWFLTLEGNAIHYGHNDPINTNDIRSGYNAVKNGGTISIIDYTPTVPSAPH